MNLTPQSFLIPRGRLCENKEDLFFHAKSVPSLELTMDEMGHSATEPSSTSKPCHQCLWLPGCWDSLPGLSTVLEKIEKALPFLIQSVDICHCHSTMASRRARASLRMIPSAASNHRLSTWPPILLRFVIESGPKAPGAPKPTSATIVLSSLTCNAKTLTTREGFKQKPIGKIVSSLRPHQPLP